MRLFGLDITLASKDLSQIGPRGSGGFGGWWPIIREPFAGAWQRNRECRADDITAFHAVFACITLIASDIAKMEVKVKRQNSAGVWEDATSSNYDAVLTQPNHYQNRIQFWENWILSKLMRGNTYVLKQRDNRNLVNRLYILDPCRVRVLVSDNGDVFYQLMDDRLSRQSEAITVPGSEIIHDRWNTLYHPLCGIPPLYAAGLAAMQGLKIQTQTVDFYDNNAMPGGILSAPTRIPEQTIAHMKQQWETNYSGANRGKVAILGNGLKFDALTITPQASQMIETAKATAEWVCSVFHVPLYKIGLGPMPGVSNVQALNVEYYSQCLQTLIEAAELCLDIGLELKSKVAVEFDIDGLLRMDTVSQVQSLKESVLGGMHAPNEARAKLGLPAVKGGESPYLQQQNFSLAALDKRDSQEDPFKPAAPATPPASASPPPQENTNAQGSSPQQRAALIRSSADHVFRLAKRHAA